MSRKAEPGYRVAGCKTITEWIVEHGIERNDREFEEGPRCLAIAAEMGLEVPSDKIVTRVNSHAVRQFPEAVLDAWGRDYLRRREIETSRQLPLLD